MKKDKLIDNRNKDLYDGVRQHYKVNLKKSDDHSWGSNLIKDTVVISHSKTNYPISAFTHELLHIDTQLSGYKRIRAAVSINPTIRPHLPRLVDCIDNEFQHHKMFDKFTSLGFPANEFYNDLDNSVVPYLENVLNTSGSDFISLSVDYLTLIAPGGTITSDKLIELRSAFHNYGNNKFVNQFQKIDTIIEDWKKDTSYDAEKYIIQFFQNLNAGQIWVSYADNLHLGLSDQNFPSSGYFTETNFTLQELAKAYGQ